MLDFLSITDFPWEDVEKEVTMFMIATYGGSGKTTSECHKWLWAQKTARSYAALKLASLPLTTEGFLQNAKRALKSDPPSLNPLDYCWEADDVNNTLYPTTVAEGVCVAPDCILKLICTGCDSEIPCRSGNCGCTGHQIPCTMFCACGAGFSC